MLQLINSKIATTLHIRHFLLLIKPLIMHATICIEEKWMDGWLFDYLRTLIIKQSNNYLN